MSKVMGIFLKFWSCHVTQDANFKNFLFCPNSTLNISKSHKIFSGKALYLEVISKKPHGGTTPPPRAFSVKVNTHQY